MRLKITILLILLITVTVQAAPAAQSLDKTGSLFGPYLEWEVTNTNYEGNPFDVIAEVTFTHESGESLATQMFYVPPNLWRFRFTGTLIGEWDFISTSGDPELNGLRGTVTIGDNPGARGFVGADGYRWIWTGTGEAFVPQLVMAGGPHVYYNNDTQLDADIQTLMVEHGFTGLNVPVFCRWLDINEESCGDISRDNVNPDPRTFEALEAIITRAYSQGGMVHIWKWGDNQRGMNVTAQPSWDGLNGDVDERVQRYVAARLGPIPGWTMGYGFDLFEWVRGPALDTWHENMQSYLGWPHLLGARSSKNELDQLSEAMDYSAYEQHRPDYDKYVETLNARPEKPSFSEDRFRVREDAQFDDKDYTYEMTRRGLWHSTMAGGVANIWGNLLGDASSNLGDGASLPYPNVNEISTYFTFWSDRFKRDMVRCNDLTNGVCLYSPAEQLWVFYIEDASSIDIDLSSAPQDLFIEAYAVNTAAAYEEVPITLQATSQTHNFGSQSDWAIVVRAADSQALAQLTLAERTLQAQVDIEVQSNSAVETLVALDIDIRPSSIFMRVLQKDGTRGSVLVVIQNILASGIVVLQLSTITMNGGAPTPAFRRAVNYEVLPVLTDSIDTLVLADLGALDRVNGMVASNLQLDVLYESP
jgi:hypothetical protein